MSYVGIMGGSFNPVHTGHLIVASYIRQTCGFDEVWLSVSPCNPLKEGTGMAPDSDRLEMLKLALSPGSSGLKATGIEMELPRPSYTIVTLRTLASRYPHHRFRLIVGSDNWLNFSRWRQWQEIIDEFGVTVYPRPGYPVENRNIPPGVEIIEAPQIELSSTLIRSLVAEGRDIRWMTTDKVIEYIKTHNLYR